MKVIEEYFCLQGEGKYIGTPSYLIRTTGCNLRCAWKDESGLTYCDTPFTSWHPEKGEDLDMRKTLQTLAKSNIKHIILSGGEPCMYPDITQIVASFANADYFVTVETNGTIFRPLQAFLSISPKLSSSYAQPFDSQEAEAHKKNNIFLSTVQKYLQQNECQLKFVINSSIDIFEAVDLIRFWEAKSDIVYLMPQGILQNQFAEKRDIIINACLQYGFQYSPRLHIDLFGNQRGT